MDRPVLPATSDIFRGVFPELRNRHEEIRSRAARTIAAYIAEQARELQGDIYTSFSNDLNRHIFELANSPNPSDRLGAIALIDELIDIDYDENLGTKITRLATHLRTTLSSTDPQVIIAAAKAIGHLAKANTSNFGLEFVEFEVKRSFEWLQYEPRRFASVNVLKQLALNVPTLFIVHVSVFFDQIWEAIRDPKDFVREGAADALGACLQLVAERENGSLFKCYDKTFEEALQGFKMNTAEAIHGSLLTIGEVLSHTGTLFMKEKFHEVCNHIFRYKSNPNRLIRRTVINLLPRLAHYFPDQFVQNYLNVCMSYLLETLKKINDTNTINYGSYALISMGEIALAVGSYINPYLDQVVKKITSIILKRKDRLYSAALVCVRMFASAVGSALGSYMDTLPDMLFSTGLSPELMEALGELSKHIASHRPIVQYLLLNRLSLVLVGKPYDPRLIAPLVARHLSSERLATETSRLPPLDRDTTTLVLALRTLHMFDFEPMLASALAEFAHHALFHYLGDDEVVLRREAALACSKLIRNAPLCGTARLTSMIVLKRLLALGVSDPDGSVRTTIISSFEPRLDYYLAQTDYLQYLFMMLQDEAFNIRELALKLLGRLAERNPAYVLPHLRNLLIQLRNDLSFTLNASATTGVSPVTASPAPSTSGVAAVPGTQDGTKVNHANSERSREEAAQLFVHLLSTNYEPLVAPYVEPLLRTLLPRLRDPNPRVASHILRAIGELSRFGRERLQPHLPVLIPLIIETVQDQGSSARRDVALHSLSLLIENTGCVVDPLLQYPKLLEVLLFEIRSEPNKSIRRNAIKVLGQLGALNPDSVRATIHLSSDAVAARRLQEEQLVGEKSHAEKPKVKGEINLAELSPSAEEYYPLAAFTALLKILRDPSLSAYHTRVLEGLVLLFRSAGNVCVPFLAPLFPPFLALVRSEPDLRGFLFQQLAKLVSICKQNMHDYLPQIFTVISEYWHTNCIAELINLVEEIASTLRNDFKEYLPRVLPLMSNVLYNDSSPERLHSMKVLHAFRLFDASLYSYEHLVVPPVARLFEVREMPSLQREAAHTCATLANALDLAQLASRIIQPLVRGLDLGMPSDSHKDVLEVVCALAQRLQIEFVNIFHPGVSRALRRHGLPTGEYDKLIGRIIRDGRQPEPGTEFQQTAERKNSVLVHPPSGADVLVIKKLKLNEQNLRKAWEVAQRSTKEDWMEWIRWFAVEQLRESPSPALRSCLALAQVYQPLAQELFNAGFLSNWAELEEDARKELVHTLQTALSAPNIPPELLQTLLNLAEFMEHDDKPLPLPSQMLSALADKCKAYAKALHYKEMEFHANNVRPEVIESLISINNHLQEPEAAVGVLNYAQKHHSIELRESWYEKLGRWEEALEAYDRKASGGVAPSPDLQIARMRCLRALGEWERLAALSQNVWKTASENARRDVAPLAAAAAWNLHRWDHMDDYVAAMRDSTLEGTFFRAITSLHRDQYADCERALETGRDLVANELSALVGESYSRAYSLVVMVQQLSELEELIAYKRAPEESPVRERLRQVWNYRLKGAQRDVDVWQRLLAIHSLVIPVSENIETWLKFCSIARKSGRINLCQRTLRKLLNLTPASSSSSMLTLTAGAPPVNARVMYAYIKYLWATKRETEALDQLKQFASRLTDEPKLQAKCYLHLGLWQRALEDELTDASVKQVLGYLELATRFDEKGYKAWHAWALFNFHVVDHLEHRPHSRTGSIQPLIHYVLCAINGFFNSIALGSDRSLQDILRLLTLMFNHNQEREVEAALTEGFRRVSIDTWLKVIPQLIARVHTQSESLRRLLHTLLSDVGKVHPQALVFPLTVASKSQNVSRVQAAEMIMARLRVHSPVLVEQAMLVAQELIRVAILWHELWYEGLEEAYRLFLEQDIEGMFNTLEPLHTALEKGPETPNEVYFAQMFGQDLTTAWETCKRFHRSAKNSDLNKAWDIYHGIFRKIRHLPQVAVLELRQVSPRLLAARNFSLAVPGTYLVTQQTREEIVCIRNFAEATTVISSKQRPRKLIMFGSDGMEYTYLLKGHEDLRQDERVMQLFGLVNGLLTQDPETSKNNLSIQRYAVIPLSPNSGLIGWVPQCDTLHALIRDYRAAHKIPLDIERKLMLQVVPAGVDANYERLELIQRVEAFEYAQDNTSGLDLYKILWLKSANSEMWLYRRGNYTRSLAVMSMVGYILGLGDRHPNNLMLDRLSGKIMHIDFGDCFEVAMSRDRYSEKVPFRLTRMLINAMEVSGIEGNFRVTCESVMRVLHENKESLMAMLEAFVYDPLINWRLLTANSPDATKPGKTGKDKAPQSTSPKLSASQMPGLLNERAVTVLQRVSKKLTGRDFGDAYIDVPTQVEKLIQQATSPENLCQSYMGWCPFW